MDDWNKSNKPVWITETGIDDWDAHKEYYYEWTSRFVEYMGAEKIFWYRHSIASKNDPDGGFALEARTSGERSQLWQELVNI